MNSTTIDLTRVCLANLSTGEEPKELSVHTLASLTINRFKENADKQMALSWIQVHSSEKEAIDRFDCQSRKLRMSDQFIKYGIGLIQELWPIYAHHIEYQTKQGL